MMTLDQLICGEVREVLDTPSSRLPDTTPPIFSLVHGQSRATDQPLTPHAQQLESLVQEKSDAAELVLDGRLIGERTEEVNLAELLKVARREFNEKDHTLDEALLQAEWPKLRAKLTTAMQGWETGFIEAPAEVEPVTSAVIVNAATGFTPSEAPVLLPKVLPDDLLTQSAKIIPFPLPTPNWKSRLRARTTRLDRLPRTDAS